MVAAVPIADELLADAIDSGDRTAVSEVLNRPDPFDSFTAEFLKWAETCPIDEF